MMKFPSAKKMIADILEDDVNTAVSTRAAIQALTEGVADMMRHDATFQSNLAESVKVLAQQQVMTNWELQLAVQTLTDQREKEIAEDARHRFARRADGLREIAVRNVQRNVHASGSERPRRGASQPRQEEEQEQTEEQEHMRRVSFIAWG